jgi:resuscitation-promoting factor RpfB
MINIARKSNPLFGMMLGIGSLIFLVFGFLVVSQVQAASARPQNGERLITIHEGNRNRGILTRADTLRQAFREANIEIDARDRVEPGLDEELVASSYDVNVYRARPVIIADGAVRKKIMTPYQTPKQIAKDAEITLQDEDIATLSANTNMVSDGAGVQLTVKRAKPFMFVFYGTNTPSYTQAKTVGEMLKQKKITLGKDDTLSVPPQTEIQPGMTIELWRNGIQTATAEENIPFGTEQIKDADRPVGYKEIKTPGTLGKKTVTYAIEMKNGQEVSRTSIQSVITTPPVNQVEVVGTKMANTFNGSFAEALARLRSCEGSYTSNTGNGYYGAYQFDRQTWGNYGGYAVASDAPPEIQDEKAWLTYQRRGWQPWPSCSKKMGLQDIYR